MSLDNLAVDDSLPVIRPFSPYSREPAITPTGITDNATLPATINRNVLPAIPRSFQFISHLLFPQNSPMWGPFVI
jgi:hypothetical protein